MHFHNAMDCWNGGGGVGGSVILSGLHLRECNRICLGVNLPTVVL